MYASPRVLSRRALSLEEPRSQKKRTSLSNHDLHLLVVFRLPLFQILESRFPSELPQDVLILLALRVAAVLETSVAILLALVA